MTYRFSLTGRTERAEIEAFVATDVRAPRGSARRRRQPGWFEVEAQRLVRAVLRNGMQVLLTRCDGELVAVSHFRFQPPDVFDVIAVAVAHGWHRKSVGGATVRHLMVTAVDLASAAETSQVVFTVRIRPVDTSSASLARSTGLQQVEVGESITYYAMVIEIPGPD